MVSLFILLHYVLVCVVYERNCYLALGDEDVAVKVKRLLRADLEHAAATGLLTASLHYFLLVLNILLPIDTQEVEGFNSVIKVMTDRAPSMKVPLLNARLTIKKNHRLSPHACAEMDADIEWLFTDSEYQQARFAPVSLHGGSAPSDFMVVCEHSCNTSTLKASSVACQIGRVHAASNRYCYNISLTQHAADALPTSGFMLTLRVRLQTHCSLGKRVDLDGLQHFELQHPDLAFTQLSKLAQELYLFLQING